MWICGWSETIATVGAPCRRELGTLGVCEGQKEGRKQDIVLVVGWKCIKHWSNIGITCSAFQPFVVPVETRELPNLCASNKL